MSGVSVSGHNWQVCTYVRACVCVCEDDAQQPFNALFKSTHNVTPFPYKISVANAPEVCEHRGDLPWSTRQLSMYSMCTVCCGIDMEK